MTRDVRWYLVGSLVLVLLAGCGRNFFAQREAWRREAEVQCLKTGAVKEGPAIAMLSPIDGPGICGTDFPFKVAALGDTQALGYADEPIRPPGAIRGGSTRTSSSPAPPYRGGSSAPFTSATGSVSPVLSRQPPGSLRRGSSSSAIDSARRSSFRLRRTIKERTHTCWKESSGSRRN